MNYNELVAVDVCIWADGTWCEEPELEEYLTFMSDDFALRTLWLEPESFEGEDAVEAHLIQAGLIPAEPPEFTESWVQRSLRFVRSTLGLAH